VSIATLVLCPPLPGGTATIDTPELTDAILDHMDGRNVSVISPTIPAAEPNDDLRTQHAHWVAYLAVALSKANAVSPVMLVLSGTNGPLVTALGFSQRASRRAVGGYVLVEADIPSAQSRINDWPDAPVFYVASPTADPDACMQARLRGWTMIDVPDLSAPVVSAALANLL